MKSLTRLNRIWMSALLTAVLVVTMTVQRITADDNHTDSGFALMGKTVVVDAGHGGPDGGATSSDGKMEKDVTLAVAKELAGLLRQSGAIVYLTRSIDDDLATDEDRSLGRRQQRDLRNRTRFTLGKEPDAFISVHCNAVPSPIWRGAHTIYMKGNEDGERLAKLMQDRFRMLLLPTKREADDMSTLFLLKRIPGPTVLAEIGFLSNPDEAGYLVRSDYQHRVAFAMYLSVLDYFRTQERTSPAKPEQNSG